MTEDSPSRPEAAPEPKPKTSTARREEGARGHQRALILDTARLLAQEILPTGSGVEALRYLAEAARELTGARYSAIGVAQAEGSGFADLVTAGFSPSEQAAFAASRPGPRSQADGILRLLLEREEPLCLQATPEEGGETFLGVSLRRGPLALGALYVTSKDGAQPFTAQDKANVQALGVHATVAISNLRALERERSLVSGLLSAHEEERRAIAYDLHDGLAQTVLAAHIHLEAFEYAQAGSNSQKAARELSEVSKYLQESVLESRRLINGLRSLPLDELGLSSALEVLLHEEREHAGWDRAELNCNIGGQRFDKTLETAVYRIAQEALTNARKHAQTCWVQVLCRRETDNSSGHEHLRLEVQDGGRGFDAQARAQSMAAREGIGLQSMAERVRILHGSFSSHSVPGEGASIQAVFPLPEASEAKLDEPLNPFQAARDAGAHRVAQAPEQALEQAPGQAPEQASAREMSVLLVDDHTIWCRGVRSILEGTAFHVVGEASSGREGVEAVRALRPQIVLLDVRMAGGDGLDALRTIKSEYPQTSVVMLSSYENPTYMARAVASGASGYLLKGLKRAELMAALRAVAGGEMLLSREALDHSLRGLSQSQSEAASVAQDLIHPLSEREMDVLRLLATGLNNREIGALLFVSENTVKTHMVHIIGKLGVSDRVQAAVWAARRGLLELP